MIHVAPSIYMYRVRFVGAGNGLSDFFFDEL